VERVYEELLRRAKQAAAEAERRHKRASQLTAFVRALQRTNPGELVRCAWCGRISADGEWIDPSTLIGGSLRERLRQNATHGICPDCLERVSAEAERERARRSS
jgi:hypothetical protein